MKHAVLIRLRDVDHILSKISTKRFPVMNIAGTNLTFWDLQIPRRIISARSQVFTDTK